MNRSNRFRFFAGILLILAGVWFLLVKFYPELGNWIHIEMTWPLIVIGVGVFLLFLGLLVGEPGMAVPACIVGGIGGILYWQNATDNMGSWSYAWSLIPGFVGIGILLSGLLEGKFRKAWNDGIGLLLVSAFTFLIFGSWLGELPFHDYWPILIILLGVWILVRSLFRPKR